MAIVFHHAVVLQGPASLVAAVGRLLRLDAKSRPLVLVVEVVEEELLTTLDLGLGVDADVLVAAHRHNAGLAVGRIGVVEEPRHVTLGARIHHLRRVQVK
eukprot:6183648-Pleurochrysis_carterae.AAC.1